MESLRQFERFLKHTLGSARRGFTPKLNKKDPCIRVEYRLKGDFHPFANFYKTCINLAKTGFIKITNWIKIVIYPTSNPNAGVFKICHSATPYLHKDLNETI
ncbi:hypothetical protein SPBRAN_763 [uncultured Candidatus Thioglobus sp.]|nr:hypothetical protein SPBRAN_763 [uncultured Candidatus Thioglobus sp.]